MRLKTGLQDLKLGKGIFFHYKFSLFFAFSKKPIKMCDNKFILLVRDVCFLICLLEQESDYYSLTKTKVEVGLMNCQ